MLCQKQPTMFCRLPNCFSSQLSQTHNYLQTLLVLCLGSVDLCEQQTDWAPKYVAGKVWADVRIIK